MNITFIIFPKIFELKNDQPHTRSSCMELTYYSNRPSQNDVKVITKI